MRALALSLLAVTLTTLTAQEAPAPSKSVKLPAPAEDSFSLSKALRERKSERALSGPALSLNNLSQLLWAAQGENRPGKRTVPSARAKYPLELYVVVAKSDALPEGVYKYSPKDHSILKIKDGSPETIFKGSQPWIPKAPAVFIFSGVSSRLGDGNAAELYTFWESGASSQALLLQVAASGLGATVASGVDLDAVKTAAGLSDDERVSVVIPVGRLAK